MQNFKYRARNKKGSSVRGEISAQDLAAAKRLIAAEGLIVLEVKESSSLSPFGFINELIKDYTQKVPSEDIIIFNRQLQIVYTVGIPILNGIQMIQEQTPNPVLKKAIGEILRAVSEGTSLASAIAKHDRIFDPVYVNLIRIGEETGELQTMLERASELIEQRSEQREKVKSAMFYPKLVVGFTGIVLLVVVYVILPRLQTFFTQNGGELPWLTRTVMGTSDFFVTYWYAVAAIGAGLVWGTKALLAQPQIRYKFDEFVLKMPVAGKLILEIEVNTFCSLLEILLRSGVSIVEAFTHVEKSAGNVVVAQDIANCKKEVESGGSLGAGLGRAKAFPPMVTGLIAMGEEGGSLPKVLGQIASYYKVQVNHKLNNLSKLIEPILLFVIFGIVLIIALAVFLPMWKMSSSVKR